jgi:TENA/THI-4/PQQC family
MPDRKLNLMSVSAIPKKPRLLAEFQIVDGALQLVTASGTLDVEPSEGITSQQLAEVLGRLDGSRTIEDLASETDLNIKLVSTLLATALEWGLLGDAVPPEGTSGLAALSRIEDILNFLLEELVFAGPFWKAITENPEKLHHNVFYGYGLENWFFLKQESEFDSAILAYAESGTIRSMANDFYHEEHRHDDIVLRGFEFLGITGDQLAKARPLPTTTALIKQLSWWGRTDPLFFIATIGILEGRINASSMPSEGKVAYDSFLEACDKIGLAAEFVEPIRAHARVNAMHDHGTVSREFFAEIPGVDDMSQRRWEAKAHVFMETYAAFFNGILRYYNVGDNPLLRTVEI